jgi:hypothetical protein
MTRRIISLAVVVVLAFAGSVLPATASAADAPSLQLTLMSSPTNFPAGSAPGQVSQRYFLYVSNVGAAPTTGTIKVKDTVPPGLTPTGAGFGGGPDSVPFEHCAIVVREVSCEIPHTLQPGMTFTIEIGVEVETSLSEGDGVVDRATAEDEGSGVFSEASTTTTISSLPASFNFLPDPAGLGTTMTGPDGQALTQAGAHPYELNINLNFASTSYIEELFGAQGGVRDATSSLPRGLVLNPKATVKCTEVQFEGYSCPEASQVAIADTKVGFLGGTQLSRDLVYNMVSPAGSAATFAFDGGGAGIFVHIAGGVRAGDYTLFGSSHDVPSLAGLPFLGTSLQFWGDPSSSSHDYTRGNCGNSESTTDICPAIPQRTPLLTAPTSCGGSLAIEGETDSWDPPSDVRRAVSELTDQNGNPSGISGCASVPFNPTLEARPTTNVADSSSGLKVDLEVPQSDDIETISTSHLRKATVTLPPGLVLNPSSANGLSGCTTAQIGLGPVSNGSQLIRLVSHEGPFTLNFEGDETAPIPAYASAEDVQGALEALPNLAAGDADVSGVPGGPYRVEFGGARAGKDIGSLSGIGLTDAAEQVAVDATGGSFTLTYGAGTTTDLPANATSAEVRDAIDALPSVSSAGASVMVAGGPGDAGATNPYLVTFNGGAFTGTEQSLSAESSIGDPLSGGAATVTTATVAAGGEPYGVDSTSFVKAGEIRFDGSPAQCPNSSKVGTVEVETPLLDDPLPGSVYVANSYENPFGAIFALYIAVEDPQSGVIVKLAGQVTPDPNTGQLVSTFDEGPQLPFSHFRLSFFGGAGGVLRTPATCGNYSTTSELSPWSGNPPAKPHDGYAISQAPSGASCPADPGQLPNAPSLNAGSVSPIAAASTPTVVNLRRDDGTQEFSSVRLALPPGLTGKLAGIGQCPDATLAAAAAKTGHAEQANPSCPASSRIGRVDVAAGAGPAPYNTQGTAYLTGPYKGAPLGMAIVTPAVAGPYDLGTVVVRVALNLDPNSGKITAVSDEIPHILQGIVLDIRSARVLLDRPDFTRNGTSCDPFSFDGSLTSTLGQTTPLSERFQLGECANLAFRPKLGIRLFGGTKRGGHPALRGTLAMPAGGANIAKAVVALPHSEFLDQGHIGTVCTRVQFAEGDGNGSACPAASIYGHATATSPLVDYALEGNAYLRSSTHELPDLVVALHGPPSQPVAVDAVGRIDSVKGGIRTSFESVPDLPVSSFVLNMQGGKKGLLQNSTNVCRGEHRATVELDAQSGKAVDLKPALKNGKCGKAKKKHSRRRLPSSRHTRGTR